MGSRPRGSCPSPGRSGRVDAETASHPHAMEWLCRTGSGPGRTRAGGPAGASDPPPLCRQQVRVPLCDVALPLPSECHLTAEVRTGVAPHRLPSSSSPRRRLTCPLPARGARPHVGRLQEVERERPVGRTAVTSSRPAGTTAEVIYERRCGPREGCESRRALHALGRCMQARRQGEAGHDQVAIDAILAAPVRDGNMAPLWGMGVSYPGWGSGRGVRKVSIRSRALYVQAAAVRRWSASCEGGVRCPDLSLSADSPSKGMATRWISFLLRADRRDSPSPHAGRPRSDRISLWR
jgi:hypothetical protein